MINQHVHTVKNKVSHLDDLTEFSLCQQGTAQVTLKNRRKQKKNLDIVLVVGLKRITVL